MFQTLPAVTTDAYCLQVLLSSLEEEAPNYEPLGLALGLPYSEVQEVGKNVGAPTVHDKFAAMIQWWLLNPDDQERRENTWEFLLSAIKRCKDMEMASRVESSEFYAAKKPS